MPKNQTKVVPVNIENLLTPIGLAYWIMDDGSIQNKGLHLNTYGFSLDETTRLKETLENLFGKNSMRCSIHKHKKGNRIYIWEESMDCLRKNITQFMHKDMLYKISNSLAIKKPARAVAAASCLLQIQKRDSCDVIRSRCVFTIFYLSMQF